MAFSSAALTSGWCAVKEAFACELVTFKTTCMGPRSGGFSVRVALCRLPVAIQTTLVPSAWFQAGEPTLGVNLSPLIPAATRVTSCCAEVVKLDILANSAGSTLLVALSLPELPAASEAAVTGVPFCALAIRLSELMPRPDNDSGAPVAPAVLSFALSLLMLAARSELLVAVAERLALASAGLPGRDFSAIFPNADFSVAAMAPDGLIVVLPGVGVVADAAAGVAVAVAGVAVVLAFVVTNAGAGTGVATTGLSVVEVSGTGLIREGCTDVPVAALVVMLVAAFVVALVAVFVDMLFAAFVVVARRSGACSGVGALAGAMATGAEATVPEDAVVMAAAAAVVAVEPAGSGRIAVVVDNVGTESADRLADSVAAVLELELELELVFVLVFVAVVAAVVVATVVAETSVAVFSVASAATATLADAESELEAKVVPALATLFADAGEEESDVAGR